MFDKEVFFRSAILAALAGFQAGSAIQKEHGHAWLPGAGAAIAVVVTVLYDWTAFVFKVKAKLLAEDGG